MIDVSIIIVNYNKFNLLTDCLRSIYNNSFGFAFEVIVVDNNSNEEHPEDILTGYENLTLIKNEKSRGFSAANNQGLKAAQGKFILFLNNDTLLIENTIKKVIDFLKEKNEMTLVGCKLLNKDFSHQVSIVDFDNLWNLAGENFFLYLLFPKCKKLNRYHFNYKVITQPIEVDVIKGAFIFGYTKTIKAIAGFDERFFFFSEENDLCFRLKQCGGKVFYYPGTAIIHFGGATTSTIPWFMFKNLSLAKIRFFQKHLNGFEFVIAVAIHFTGIILRIPLYFTAGVISFNKNLIKKSYYFFKLLFVYPHNSFK